MDSPRDAASEATLEEDRRHIRVLIAAVAARLAAQTSRSASAAGANAEPGASASAGDAPAIWFRSVGGALAAADAAAAARASRLAADIIEEGGAADPEDAFFLPAVADEDLAAVVRAVEWVGSTPKALQICRNVRAVADQPWADHIHVCVDLGFLAGVLGAEWAETIATVFISTTFLSKFSDAAMPGEAAASAARLADRAALVAEAFAYLGVEGGDIATLIATGWDRLVIEGTPGRCFVHEAVAARVNRDTAQTLWCLAPALRTEAAAGTSEGPLIRREGIFAALGAARKRDPADPLHLVVAVREASSFGDLAAGAADVPANVTSFTLDFGAFATAAPDPASVAGVAAKVAAALPPFCVLRLVGVPGGAARIATGFLRLGGGWDAAAGMSAGAGAGMSAGASASAAQRGRRVEIFDQPRAGGAAPALGRRADAGEKSALARWIASGRAAPAGGELALFFAADAGREWGSMVAIPPDVVDAVRALDETAAGSVVVHPLCRSARLDLSLDRDTPFQAPPDAWAGVARVVPALAVGRAEGVPAVLRLDDLT